MQTSAPSIKHGTLSRFAAFAAVLALVFALACSLTACGPSQPVENEQGEQLEVAKTVNDYSWSELKDISNAISKAEDADKALEIAKSYNLVNSEGKLDGTQIKSFKLANGKKMGAQIIGIYHDDKADGSGKAGITFLLTKPLAFSKANAGGTTGGWKDSAMRSWLSKSGLKKLPSDLRKMIVSVSKRSNNVGATSDTSSVTATKDKLWLLSTVEFTGPIEAKVIRLDDEGTQAAVYNAEGERYQLFSDVEIDCSRDTRSKYYIGTLNELLVRKSGKDTCMWWERSVYDGSSSDFYCVMDGGSPIGNAAAGYQHGLVPAFCI